MAMLKCPEFGSTKVYTCHVQAFDANTGEFVVHRFKTHDGRSPAGCGNFKACTWTGVRAELMEDGEKR